MPDACELTIVLRGDLAAILRFAAEEEARLPLGGRGSGWPAIAGRLGFLGMVVPEEFGGAGADYVSYALAVMELRCHMRLN